MMMRIALPDELASPEELRNEKPEFIVHEGGRFICLRCKTEISDKDYYDQEENRLQHHEECHGGWLQYGTIFYINKEKYFRDGWPTPEDFNIIEQVVLRG